MLLSFGRRRNITAHLHPGSLRGCFVHLAILSSCSGSWQVDGDQGCLSGLVGARLQHVCTFETMSSGEPIMSSGEPAARSEQFYTFYRTFITAVASLRPQQKPAYLLERLVFLRQAGKKHGPACNDGVHTLRASAT